MLQRVRLETVGFPQRPWTTTHLTGAHSSHGDGRPPSIAAQLPIDVVCEEMDHGGPSLVSTSGGESMLPASLSTQWRTQVQ